MKILPQKYCLAMHCAAFLMLVWLYLFLLHNCQPPIYLTFCAALHSATCDSAEGESRVIIQSAIHCRSWACKGSTEAPTLPWSNTANQSDTEFKYTNRNPWRLISQNEVLRFRSVKLIFCAYTLQMAEEGRQGEEL